LHVPSAKDIEHLVRALFPSPIFQSGANRYEIDTCAPQLKAMREGKIELHALSKGHYPGKRMDLNELPGLANIGFWNCRTSQDWGVQAHRNEGLEIVFLETGAVDFEVDGKSHPLKAGNLTLTRPWQLHRLGNPNIGRGRLHWIILDLGIRRPNQEWKWPSWVVLPAKDLAELTRKLRHCDQSVWVANPRMRQVFRDLAACVLHWKERHVASRLVIAINQLLVELLDVLAEQQVDESSSLASRRRTVGLFLQDLLENPASCAKPWTLEAMAAECGMGITAMAKYCKELVNIGPVAYLNQCRLEHAARFIRDPKHTSIIEIAMRVGFNSSQYFATLFRKRHKMTPMQYRSQFRRA
jgi:AraC-like DNA-binding protein